MTTDEQPARLHTASLRLTLEEKTMLQERAQKLRIPVSELLWRTAADAGLFQPLQKRKK